MNDELEKAILEHDEARKELQEFWDEHLGKVMTPEADVRLNRLEERERKTRERMLELLREG